MTRAAAQGSPFFANQPPDDVRFELSARAAASESRHRPVYFLGIAGLLLAASIAALIWSLSARASAEARLGTELTLSEQFAAAATRYKQLRALPKDESTAGGDSSTIGTQIKAAAKRAGLNAADSTPFLPAASRDSVRVTGGARRTKYVYTSVQDPSLEALITWVNAAVEDVPGLKVYSLTLEPQASGWKLAVTFTRWERLTP